LAGQNLPGQTAAGSQTWFGPLLTWTLAFWIAGGRAGVGGQSAPEGAPRTVSAATGVVAAPAVERSDAGAWAQVPGILARIAPPTFPRRDFPITDFGARGDGHTDCTRAVAAAIEACHRAGGGRVVVPPGRFLTGAIHLRSRVNLHLTAGAVIRFSTNVNAYLPAVFTRYESTEVMNYSPFVYAFGQQDLAVTGQGTLDGQASAGVWHQWKQTGVEDARRLAELADRGVPVAERRFGEGHRLRPVFLQLVRCRNILIEGVRFTDSPMWVINPVCCTNVTVRGVTVDSKGRRAKAPNADGCNPECCRDVLIEGCAFNTDDDCIALKAGRDADGRRVNLPCENVLIRHCRFQAGHGGVTAGSETAGGIRNVFAENCQFDSPDLRMAIRLKTNPRRGGGVEGFYVRNCTVQTAETGVHMTMRYENVAQGDAIPFLRHIDIRRVTFERLQQALCLEGLSPSAAITDVTIADCVFRHTSRKSVVLHADNVRLVNTVGAGWE